MTDNLEKRITALEFSVLALARLTVVPSASPEDERTALIKMLDEFREEVRQRHFSQDDAA